MNRWALVALGAGVTAAIVALLWEIHSDPPTPDTPVVAAKAAAPAPGSRQVPPPRAPLPRKAPTADPPAAPDVANMTEEERLAHAQKVHRESLLIGGDVPQHVMKAAATCYHGESGQYERVHLKYKLHFHSGTATLSDVTFVSSEWHNPRMEQCVIRVMQNLTWQDESAPELDTDMQADMSILDLAKRNQPMPTDDSANEPDDN